jgi:hypothetical protein
MIQSILTVLKENQQEMFGTKPLLTLKQQQSRQQLQQQFISESGKCDIWRDTNEENMRLNWKLTATRLKTVREEMEGWKPRTRDSAKRMKQNINQIRLDTCRTWGNHSAFSTVSFFI